MQVLGLCLDHWTWVFEVSIPTFSLSVSYHFGGESQIIYSEYLLESRIIFWLLTFLLTFFCVYTMQGLPSYVYCEYRCEY